MSPASRSTRDRPAKPPLSQEAVVDAALAILRAEGLAAVTMRRVATELSTGAASLYVYVSGREGLLEAMQDRITAGVGLEPPDAARWREQLHGLLGRALAALLAHPGIAIVSMAEPPSSEATHAVLENLLGILLAGGLEVQDAAWGADIFWLLVTYAALEDDIRRPDPKDMADHIFKTFSDLPTDRFPLIAAHAAPLTAGSGDVRFRFAVDVVVDGLLARSARE